jgi:RNA recognition motif-containing protein
MRLFVSNLNHYIEDLQLKSLFRTFGNVEWAKVILNKKTGETRGFGFVEMPNQMEAELAIKKLDQRTFYCDKISVSEAFESKKYRKVQDVDLSPRIYRDVKSNFFIILSKEVSEDDVFQVISKYLKKEKITQTITLGEYPERPKDLDSFSYMLIVSIIGNNIALMLSNHLNGRKINGHELVILSRQFL